MEPPPPLHPAPVVWTVIWAAIGSGLVIVYAIVAPAVTATVPAVLRYVPLLPVFAGAVIRWVVWPRFAAPGRAFPLFIVGLALSEAGGTVGMVLVPSLRDTYFTLGLLGVAQFFPALLLRPKS